MGAVQKGSGPRALPGPTTGCTGSPPPVDSRMPDPARGSRTALLPPEGLTPRQRKPGGGPPSRHPLAEPLPAVLKQQVRRMVEWPLRCFQPQEVALPRGPGGLPRRLCVLCPSA